MPELYDLATNKVFQLTEHESESVADKTPLVAVLKGAIPLSIEFREIASRARRLCHQLFDSEPQREVGPEWRINFETRALSPSALGHSVTGQNVIAEILSGLPSIKQLFSGKSIEFQHGRLRYQPRDQINHPLHQDRMFIDCKNFMTLWIPLIKEGQITNRDCPGLRLFRHPVPRVLEKLPIASPEADPQDLARFIPNEYEGDSFLYPELSLGDVLIFRELVPHASFIPENSLEARVSCDFRIPLEG